MELLVVIAIIAILAAILFPVFGPKANNLGYNNKPNSVGLIDFIFTISANLPSAPRG